MVCVKGRTQPKKWNRIVSSVKAGSKGGKPGVWSARKAQIAGMRYRKNGGGYCGGKTKAQKSMKKWTGEEWGRVNKRNKNSRYLPKRVRDQLTPGQKRATSRGKKLGERKPYRGAVRRLMSKSGVRKAKNRM